jgi:hypothetical protein
MIIIKKGGITTTTGVRCALTGSIFIIVISVLALLFFLPMIISSAIDSKSEVKIPDREKMDKVKVKFSIIIEKSKEEQTVESEFIHNRTSVLGL